MVLAAGAPDPGPQSAAVTALVYGHHPGIKCFGDLAGAVAAAIVGDEYLAGNPRA